MNLQDVKKWILFASVEDLNQLRDTINVRQDQLGALNALQFNTGDRVTFDGGSRGTIRGVFQSCARKNAIVKDDRGLIWRVSPHLLKME